MKLVKFLIRLFRQWRKISRSNISYTPVYRIINIERDASEIYYVVIHMIGKNSFLRIEPEKLLSDDGMVNCFSPTDIRTLTYLGYLGFNSPKYKILAKQLSEKSDQTLFAIHKKGEKNYKVVTAQEISKNDEIIQGLSQKEAHMVGLTTAQEQWVIESKQKENLLKQLHKEKP